jgi:hypothetical protein
MGVQLGRDPQAARSVVRRDTHFSLGTKLYHPSMPVRRSHLLLTLLLTLVGATVRGQVAPARCFVLLGKKDSFGSPEQVRELQKQAAGVDRKSCPTLGYRFIAPERITTIVYDRRSGVIIRVALWNGQSAFRWEYWSGVTESLLRSDDPGDGFAGQYQDGPEVEALVPRSVKKFLASTAK